MSKPPGDLSRAHRAPWTAEDDRTLARVWKYGAEAAAARLGRTVVAVGWRAKKLGLGLPASGLMSLRAAARRSGYSYAVVQRIAVDLGLEVAYAPTRCRSQDGRSTWALTPAQVELVMDAVRSRVDRSYRDHPGDARSTKGKWGVGRKPPHCHRCQRSDRPHRAKGFCGPCVHVLRRRGVPLDGPYKAPGWAPHAYQVAAVKRVPAPSAPVRVKTRLGPDPLDAMVEDAARRLENRIRSRDTKKTCAAYDREKESNSP